MLSGQQLPSAETRRWKEGNTVYCASVPPAEFRTTPPHNNSLALEHPPLEGPQPQASNPFPGLFVWLLASSVDGTLEPGASKVLPGLPSKGLQPGPTLSSHRVNFLHCNKLNAVYALPDIASTIKMSKTILTPSLAHHPSGWENQSSVRTQEGERKQGQGHHQSPRTRHLCSQTQRYFISEKAQHGALTHARSPASDLFPDMQTPGTPRCPPNTKRNRRF